MSSYHLPGAQPDTPQGSKIYYGWFLLAAAMLVSVAVSVANRSIPFSVFFSAVDFGWNYTYFAVVLLIGRLTNGLTQPVLGHLVDRYNARKVILISVAVACLAIVGLGFISDLWHLIFLYGIVFSSVMGGASFGVLGPLAARWFLKRRLLVLGLLMAAPAVGSIFSPLISGLFLTYYGWRAALMALGALPLFIALPVALIFVRNWPSERGLKPDGDPESPMEARMRGSAPVVQRGRYEVERWRQAFRTRLIWALVPVFAIGGFTTEATPALFGSIAVDVYQVGPALVTVIHTVMAASGLIGAVAVGLIADRFPRKKVLGALLLAQGLAFLVSIASPWYMGLLLASVLAGLSGITWMVVALSLIADVYGLRALATLWGIVFLFASIGSLIGRVLVGLAIGFTSSHYLPFMVCASMLVLASIAVFRINEGKYSARYQAAVEVDAVDN